MCRFLCLCPIPAADAELPEPIPPRIRMYAVPAVHIYTARHGSTELSTSPLPRLDLRAHLPQVTSWHLVWSHYMLISVAVDHPERAGVVLVALATLVALAVRAFAPCCRPPCEAAAQSHGVPPKVPRRSHSPARLKEGKAD